MKVGQQVTLLGADGATSTVPIAAVKGSGPSFYKELDLQVGPGPTEVLADVPNIRDRQVGTPCWIELDETPAQLAALKPKAPFAGKKGRK